MIDKWDCVSEYMYMLADPNKKNLPRLISSQRNESGLSERQLKEKGTMIAKYIWEFMLVDVLGYTSEQALEFVDDEFVILFRLDKTFSLFNDGLTREEAHFPDYRFILQYVYDDIKWDTDDANFDIFKRCAHIDEYRNDTNKYEYPKNFWDINIKCMEKATLYLKYIIDTYYSDRSIRELYEVFGNKRIGKSTLRKYALTVPLNYYFSSPLEFLHYTLKMHGPLCSEEYYQAFLKETKENKKTENTCQ